MATKLSENTELSMPIRNLIGLVAAATIGTWAYFGIIERLNAIENELILVDADLTKNSTFRVQFPRGTLGLTASDQEQNMLIEHLSGQFEKLQEIIETGKAPADQQTKLVLDFYEKRLTNIEEQIEKMRNKQRGD
jgi:hypothetical protein|tara:strand:- start:306 stop:710 length:405 start_codon:yes stop_codon:yes gene_type:complete